MQIGITQDSICLYREELFSDPFDCISRGESKDNTPEGAKFFEIEDYGNQGSPDTDAVLLFDGLSLTITAEAVILHNDSDSEHDQTLWIREN